MTSIIHYVKSHWDGNLALWNAFWLRGAVHFTAIVSIILAANFFFISDPDAAPKIVFFVYVSVFAIVTIIFLYHIIGLWKSASRHTRKTGRIFASATVKIFCVVVFMLFSNDLIYFAKITAYSFNIAMKGDPEIPPYSIEISDNGQRVSVTGGIKSGLASELGDLLENHPQLQTLHIESPGGRLSEALKLHALVQEHGLNTMTSSFCFSACTAVFIAGAERLAAPTATLGFHEPSALGQSQRQIVVGQGRLRHLMLDATIRPDFVDKALSIHHTEIWKPTIQELVDSNVITKVIGN